LHICISRFLRLFLLGFGLLFSLHSLFADANFTVSGGQFGAPYFNFADGVGQTPDFTTEPLYSGATYQFSDSGVSGSHPFMIGESYGDTTSSLVSGGPLNGTGGTITVSIPSDFNGSLYYFCTNHGAMIQEFNIDAPNHMVDLNSTVSLEMIWVEPGTFTMGSPTTEVGRDNTEGRETEHNVTLTKGFYLGKYEVTQAQYEAVMTGNSDGLNATPSNWPNNPDRPVEKVSWDDIQVFLTRLNSQQAGNISEGWAYVLPTEAQWEYTCRAGTTTAYSWGETISASDANWNHGNDANQTENVGLYSANPWGFFDMHGNVREWTADAYSSYATGAQTDPFNVGTSGSNRVFRGGSWYGTGTNLRSARRYSNNPSTRNHHIGFRVGFSKIPNSAPTGLSIASSSGGGQASLLKNIAYEGNSSYPAEFTEFNGEVYFNASDANGMEPWKTDGTESGTVMVKDIHPGTDSWGDPASSYPNNFTVFDGALYFAADDGNGTELWKSDGTESGTVMVKDILLDDGFGGIGSSNPGGFTEFNGSLYFSAKDGNGMELWKTDGTASGTVIVKDIYPGSNSIGESASSNPSGFAVFDGALYFSATDGNGTELWKSDGTQSGTEMVKDILLDDGFGNAGSSNPHGLTVFDGALYFSATDGNGTELWKSDGTQSGTQLLKDVYPGEDGLGSVQSGNPTNFLEFDGSLYFTGADGSGIELWKTDGTESGTSMVKDIFFGVNEWGEPSSSYPANLTVLNDHLFFDAMDENGTELWKTDGTESGTTMVKNINAEENSSSPLDLQVLGDKLFFFADDGTHGYELWESDGTTAGTKLHLDINQGAGDSARLVLYYDPGLGQEVGWFEAPLTVAGGKLFFSADDGTKGQEPYMLSGSSSSSSGSQSIELSESATVGSVVAHLSATDPEGDALSYSLVSGEGDGNNSLFTLDENGTLTTSQVLDYDAGATLSIRVQARDEHNASVEGNFTILLLEFIGNPPGQASTHTADLNASVALEMIWVQPGSFTMGSPTTEVGRNADRETQHEVTLTQGFYLGKYEVTQAQYEAVMTLG